jgi:putative flippase GtrA
MQSRFARFLVAGGFAAVANWSSRFIFSTFVSYEVAVVLAFFVGLIIGFFLMRRWVFMVRGRSVARQAASYVAVNLLALAQTFVISVVLAKWALPAVGVEHGVEGIAHLVGVLAPVATSYFGHRQVTFR